MKTNEIVRTIGIDVHKDSYSMSTFNPQSGSFVAECTTVAAPKSVVAYVDRLRKEMGVPVSIEVGYEAGPTGFGLKRSLEKAGIRCHVMAPTSIYKPVAGNRVKTDARDARTLARAVYWGSYSEVVPLSEEDEAYRDYIRMRDDRKDELKRAKQHIQSFLLRRDRKYCEGNTWTQNHMDWLKRQKFDNEVDQITFTEYLNEVTRLMDAIVLLDARIEAFSKEECYEEAVGKLRCFAGIDTHVAMVMVTEVGDFSRFGTADQFASFLGLCPGEHSSGRSIQKTGITKAGNSHCRKVLCESAKEVQEAPFKTGRTGSGCHRLCGQGNGKDKEEVHQPQGERKGYECSKGCMCQGACLLHLGDDDRQLRFIVFRIRVTGIGNRCFRVVLAG